MTDQASLGAADGGDSLPDRERASRAVFVAILVVAAFVSVYYGRDSWFGGDEWTFLVERDGADFDGVFGPVNLVHWTSIPIVLYRVLYNTVGLEHYWPYQIFAIGLHLSVAALLRLVMLRARVNPLLATAAAGVFALFGTGSTNILNAFQVTFNGSLAFGLGQLVLATHPEPTRRRDSLGVAAGLAAIMCSGLGVTMVTIVGVAVLIQRGWRAAALQVVPLATIYCVWWFGYAQSDEANALDRGTPSQWIEFIWIGLRETFQGLGQVPGVGVLLGLVLVAGLVIAWIDADSRRARITRLASPGALLAGSVLFLLISAFGRVAAEWGPLARILGPESAAASRYLHVVAALSLPALSVGADALSRRFRRALPLVVLLLLVGVPGNIDGFRHPLSPQQQARYHQANREIVLDLSQARLVAQAPTDFHPYARASPVTVGWLLRAASAGRLPQPPPLDARRAAAADALLAFAEVGDRHPSCTAVDGHDVGVELAAGEQLVFDGPPETAVRVVYISPDGTEAAPRPIPFAFASAVQAHAPIRVRWEADGRLDGVRRCS